MDLERYLSSGQHCFDAVKKGGCAVASIELARLLGREPKGFEETVRNMINGWPIGVSC